MPSKGMTKEEAKEMHLKMRIKIEELKTELEKLVKQNKTNRETALVLEKEIQQKDQIILEKDKTIEELRNLLKDKLV